MIGVRAGNKGGVFRIPWIQPEIHLWQVGSTVENEFDHGEIVTAPRRPEIPSRTDPQIAMIRSAVILAA